MSLGSSAVRQFAIGSLVVIALITVALCVATSYFIRRDILEREWDTTSTYVLAQALEKLRPEDFRNPLDRQAQSRFRAFYDGVVKMPDLVRVKIYDANMTVIWSDEPRLIGARFPDNPELGQAMRGRTVVNLEESEKKNENVFESEEPHLVELYVPVVFPATNRIVGVMETYKDPTKVFGEILRAQIAVVTMAVAGAILLHLALLGIMIRADHCIRKQHEELRAVQAQLAGAERLAAVGEVVAAVAHGIRNPLSNIRASAQVALLDCRDDGSDASRSLNNVIGEVDRLERQLKEFLRLMRPTELKSDPVDVNAVVRGARDLMKERLRAIEVDERLGPELPLVSGDAMLLEQVVANIMNNAVEALPDDEGRITITTGVGSDASGGPGVFVEIEDTGEGIEPDRLSSIFELFRTTKAQGTGLGLALAKKFTEDHGGTITVRSNPGEGASFRVTLPVRAA